MSRISRRGIAGRVLAGALLLCAVLLPASADARGVPFVKYGTLTMSVPGQHEPIRSVYDGPFPAMKQKEFAAYTIWQSEPQGTQPEDCNNGPPPEGSLDKRKSRRAEFQVLVDVDNPFVTPGEWCPGEWRAVASVYKKNRDGFYVPRLQFAKKKFQVG